MLVWPEPAPNPASLCVLRTPIFERVVSKYAPHFEPIYEQVTAYAGIAAVEAQTTLRLAHRDRANPNPNPNPNPNWRPRPHCS